MDWIPIGRLTKTHGLKGELKFHPDIPDESILDNLRHARIEGAFGTGEFRIESIRGHGTPRIIKIEGRDSIDDVQDLKGSTVLIPRSEFPPLQEGEYYRFEIIGLRVFDDEDHRDYGTVAEIIETGSNDVYVVRDGRRELLLPMIDDVVKHIDLEQGKLIFHRVEGLVEDHPV